jgi:TRAP-type C4-dicarboxylate transport system substrate-binding protein
VVPSLYDDGLISGEYEDTHPLYLFTHGPGHLHTKEKAIHKPGNLAGLKIRRPTTVWRNCSKAWVPSPSA